MDHPVLSRDAVSAHHVTGDAGDVESTTAVVALGQRDHGRSSLAFVLQLAEAQRKQLHLRDVGDHVRKLRLDELHGAQRIAELLALHDIAQRAFKTILSRTQRAPYDPVAGIVETVEWSLEAAHVRKRHLVRNEHIFHDDLARMGGPERHLVVRRRGREPLHRALHQEAPDDSLLVRAILRLGPDDGEVCDRRVGDPHLGAVHHPAAIHSKRRRLHAARVRAVIGLGQPETPDQLGLGEFGEVLEALLFGAEHVDRMHDERRLDRRE